MDHTVPPKVYRIFALRYALELEIKTGLKRRGRSAYAIIKEEFGFSGNKQTVLNQIISYIDKHIK